MISNFKSQIADRGARGSGPGGRETGLWPAASRTPNPEPRTPAPRRRGYTLVEMLVVVTILIMLVAAALPVAKKMMDGSQVREASRQFSSYWQMAKARALNTGRPCGIYFPFPTPPLGVPLESTLGMTAQQMATYWPVRQVTQMQLAEIPPPYSGGASYSRGRIMVVPGATAPATPLQFVPLGPVPDPMTGIYPIDTGEMAILTSLINVGESFLVRFDYRGPWFILQRVVDSSGNTHFNYTGKSQTGLTFAPQNQSNYQPPAAILPNHPGFKYQIVRMPRPIGNPLELPRGTCIDITYSGVGNSSRQFPPPPGGFTATPNGLIILLTPNGGIDSMFVTTPTGAAFSALSNPIASLYFLLGKVEKVPADNSVVGLINPAQFTNLDSSNLADPNSLWVVLNRGTGQVTTAENMPPPVDPTTLTSSNVLIAGQSVPAPTAINVYCTLCRQAATQGEQMGGR